MIAPRDFAHRVMRTMFVLLGECLMRRVSHTIMKVAENADCMAWRKGPC